MVLTKICSLFYYQMRKQDFYCYIQVKREFEWTLHSVGKGLSHEAIVCRQEQL
jgi:hypothetical protein